MKTLILGRAPFVYLAMSGMTEDEWLACTNPTQMLEYLRLERTTSERKLRLFAAACCRQRWEWLGERCRRAVEVLERYMDGMANADELHLAAVGAYEDWSDAFGNHHPSNAAYCAVTFQNVTSHDVAFGVVTELAEAVRCEASISKGVSLRAKHTPQLSDLAVRQACIAAGDRAMTAEREVQCHLLREIFHGPRRAIYFQSHWRTSTVVKLASAIYSEARFETMPLLAAALEESGCEDSEILGHCHQPGEHVHGCWVVDLILNKQ